VGRKRKREFDSLFTEKQNVSNVDTDVMCHLANSLENCPCSLIS
jgi:hypothetical protein